MGDFRESKCLHYVFLPAGADFGVCKDVAWGDGDVKNMSVIAVYSFTVSIYLFLDMVHFLIPSKLVSRRLNIVNLFEYLGLGLPSAAISY